MSETTLESPVSQSAPDARHILYPPGGLLIWSLVLMELFTFGVALIAFVISSKQAPEVFHQSRLQLNPIFGTINTILLLTSGYFMAVSVSAFKDENSQKTRRFLVMAMLGGGFFLILKCIEYHDKISHGFVLGYDTFFTFYWLLTSFHFIHVIVGLVILSFLFFRLPTANFSAAKKEPLLSEDYEAGAVFWHMCDLIWLLLFPVIYLIL